MKKQAILGVIAGIGIISLATIVIPSAQKKASPSLYETSLDLDGNWLCYTGDDELLLRLSPNKDSGALLKMIKNSAVEIKKSTKKWYTVATSYGDAYIRKNEKDILVGDELKKYVAEHHKDFDYIFDVKHITAVYANKDDMVNDKIQFTMSAEVGDNIEENIYAYKNPYTDKYVRGEVDTYREATLNEDGVRVRKTASQKRDNITSLEKKGVTYRILGDENNYYKVKLKSGKTGYILKDFAYEKEKSNPISNIIRGFGHKEGVLYSVEPVNLETVKEDIAGDIVSGSSVNENEVSETLEPDYFDEFGDAVYEADDVTPRLLDDEQLFKVSIDDKIYYIPSKFLELYYNPIDSCKAVDIHDSWVYLVKSLHEGYITVDEKNEVSGTRTKMFVPFTEGKDKLMVIFDDPVDNVITESTDESNDSDNEDSDNENATSTSESTSSRNDYHGDTYSSSNIYEKWKIKDFPKGTKTSNARDIIAEYACSFVGNPYLYGGTDINNGIDCSAFCQYVLHQFGFSIGRTTYIQCNESAGKTVSLKNIKRGDLVYYTRNGRTPYHVVMYLGDGKVVNAKCRSAGICISDLRTDRILKVKDYIGD